jgi:hydroxymethylpyrimidine/phosphomethylpyrimidine kinase
MIPRVLVIAGSDSGGGAGIQADIKTITALGGYASTAITALTAQNTCGVFGVFPVDPRFVASQIEVVLSDIGADAIKTGMLHSAETVEAVARVLDRYASRIPIVVDPVMIAKGGTSLLDPVALFALKTRLIPRAALLTPNAPEAEALTGLPLQSIEDIDRVADALLELGPSAVLIKGGHIPGDDIHDVLRTADGEEVRFVHSRLDSTSTHGTGCTLASAIACGIAEGFRLRDCITRAQAYLRTAILTAPGFGTGHGPLNHAHPVQKPEPDAESSPPSPDRPRVYSSP